MQTIDLKKLPAELSPTVEFLKAHLKVRVKSKGTQIQVEGAKHKEVKLLLHKFLHHQGLQGYRVLSQSGVLEIVPPPLMERPKHAEGTPPPASYTMPYFYPGTPTPMPENKRVPKKKLGTQRRPSRP